MTKTLLFSFLSIFAATAVAQPARVAKAPAHLAPAKAPAAKSAWYNVPEGTLFQVSDKAGEMAGTSYLYVPGNSWVKFQPVSSRELPAFSWHQNIYTWDANYNEVCVSYDRTEPSEDGRYYTDSDGSFYLYCPFNGANALPTLVTATDSFTISEESPYWAPLNYDTPSTMTWYPQLYSGTVYETWSALRPLSYTDERVSNIAFGGLSTGYVLGTGAVDGAPCTGIVQPFARPASPLWVEDVYLEGLSTSRTPVPAGKEITLQLRSADTSSGSIRPGDEVLAEYTATADSVHYIYDIQDGGKTYYQSNVVFGRAKGGVLIDQPFVVVVRGFDADGVDLGFLACDMPWYYYHTPDASVYLKDQASGKETQVSLYGENNIALQVNFTAKFDFCTAYVDGEDNYGIVQQSEDGQTSASVVTSRQAFNGAAVQVNGNWTENGEEQYTLTGLPSWVTSYHVDDVNFKAYGLTIISFKTTPLAEGEQGRYAEVGIQGKGVSSSNPIIIRQGDWATAISQPNATGLQPQPAARYNLAGQRVSDGYKGIVIENGVKRIAK